MATFRSELILDTCPHCGRANPTLAKKNDPIKTSTYEGRNDRYWCMFACNNCGGVVLAGGYVIGGNPISSEICETYPTISAINEAIPEKPKVFLRQAQNTLHAPAASIMVCASAVDAMLKEKKYTEDSLYKRIDKAAADHLITSEMARWAHQVRLEANDQRHADDEAPLPTAEDAKLVFDFATAFAEYLFVLPAKVSHGIGESAPTASAD